MTELCSFGRFCSEARSDSPENGKEQEHGIEGQRELDPCLTFRRLSPFPAYLAAPLPSTG